MSSPTQDSLTALSHYYVGDATLTETLTKVCASALEAIEPAVMAGLSTTVDAKPGTYVFTHPLVSAVELGQYETGDGPCLEAFHSGRTVYVQSTREPGPFPDFRAVARRNGVLSVLSTPLNTGTVTVGALNLYAESERAFSDADMAMAVDFSTHAAYLLRNAQAYWDAHTLSENLHQALQSRAVIEQAKGIIMATTGVSEDEAFARLREQSQHENVKVRDLAAEIVRRAQRPRQ